MYHYEPLATATQIAFAAFFGVFFFALYYRTQSIVPGIVLHALVDFAASVEYLAPGAILTPPSERIFSRTPAEALVSIGITLPLLLIGLFMLRKAGPDPVR
jgi:membrane protease YdiL (CAAX protease family)